MKVYKFRNIETCNDKLKLLEMINGVIKLEINKDNYKINEDCVELETAYGKRQIVPVDGVLPGTVNIEFNNSVLWHSSPDKFIDQLDVNLPSMSHLSENNILNIIHPDFRKHRKLLSDTQIASIGLESMQSIINSVRSGVGICSLAKSYSNIKLWNEYTSNGQGIALEFEIDDHRVDEGFYHVDYYMNVDDLPILDLDEVYDGYCGDKLKLRKFFKELFCSKINEYHHEDEIRHIIQKSNIYYPVGKLTKIITGYAVSLENLRWLSEETPNYEIIETLVVDGQVKNKI